MRVKYQNPAYLHARRDTYDSCEAAAQWVFGDPTSCDIDDEKRTELAGALGRVCDLLAESGIDKGKIAAALLGKGGSAGG